MADFLSREEAPLSSEEWAQLDHLVVEVAKKQLVGRRFIDLHGPLGAGTQVVPVFTITSPSSGSARVAERQYLPLSSNFEDFSLSWQDIESARQYGTPLELGPAAVAAVACAQKEDKLVFDDLLSKAGTSAPLGDWSASGAALASIAAAVESLTSKGFLGPFAAVLNPMLYSRLYRIVAGSGLLELSLVKEVATGGVLQSPQLPEAQVLVVAMGVQNLDLAVAQDMVTAYMGPDRMDHQFRVMEVVLPRVKRPEAICLLK